MQTVQEAAALRAVVRGWREAGQSVAFVPTMGNLHEGHRSLVRLARERAERVVASVFVNPTQFGPNEDFARYPRTLAADQAALAEEGCDLLFAPEVATIYPFGPAHGVTVSVPGITTVLEGAHRPGHFDGVTTVVAKLFHLVGPDLAVFGRKDYQQLKVIERMVRDLAMPVEILPAPIRREADGLALSSRNQYLAPAERALAPELQRTLQAVRANWQAGGARVEVETAATARLVAAGFVPDYVAIRREADLAEPAEAEREGLIVLAAARLGSTRLIDNLLID